MTYIEAQQAITVAQLKAWLATRPDVREDGEPCEVWVGTGDGLSNECRSAWPLNGQDGDVLLSPAQDSIYPPGSSVGRPSEVGAAKPSLTDLAPRKMPEPVDVARLIAMLTERCDEVRFRRLVNGSVHVFEIRCVGKKGPVSMRLAMPAPNAKGEVLGWWDPYADAVRKCVSVLAEKLT